MSTRCSTFFSADVLARLEVALDNYTVWLSQRK